PARSGDQSAGRPARSAARNRRARRARPARIDLRIEAMKKLTRAGMRIPFFLFPLSILILAGCGTGPASLTLRPANQKIAYAKTFERAYAGHTDDGSRAYVLVSDAAPKNEPMRQLVYVKLHWQRMSGTRDSVAANACIDWYVMGDAG